jgi:hypothetical protein
MDQAKGRKRGGALRASLSPLSTAVQLKRSSDRRLEQVATTGGLSARLHRVPLVLAVRLRNGVRPDRAGHDRQPTKLTLRNGALAIQAMYQLGGPASATKHTFSPGKLNYTTSGLSAPINAASPNTGGQTMLFQNDAGQFLLYVWNAQVAPGGAAVPVTILFPSHAMTKIVEYNIIP